MSLPTGAKVLSAITPSSVYYLTGATTSSSTFSDIDFSRPLGKPLANYTINPVDPNIIKTVNAGVPNTSNSVPVLFKNFPDILQNDDDITVANVSTQIDVSFISEDAGYLNAFGYYFYYLDANNNPVRLTNADDNKDSCNGYYYPTIVFPNSSLNNSGGSITSGGTRRLKGNMANGSFCNVKIGFFVIPNGWSTSNNGKLTTGTGYVMHTTNQFNANYDANFVTDPKNALKSGTVDGTANGSAADPKRGVQSALLYYVTQNSWILSFEDKFRPSSDSDFNDLVLLVKKTPIPDAVEIAKYCVVTPPPDITAKGLADSQGLFLWLDSNQLCKDGSDLIFTRTTTFKTNNISYQQNGSTITTSPMNYVLNLIQHLNWNYSHQIVGYDDKKQTITQSFTFRQADISKNTVNGKVKLYLMSREFNVDNKILVTDYETNYNIMMDYQSVFVDLWYSSPGNSKYIDTEEFSFKCGGVENTALKTTNTTFQKVNITLLVWGDPYVQRVDGSSCKLPDVPGRYTLLQNSRLSIEADTATSPDTEQIPSLKGTTFFRNFYIDLKDRGKFEIDLKTMNFMSEGSVKYSLKLDSAVIGTINDEVLLHAINNDPKISYINVLLDSIKICFIRLPSTIDIQNIVMFDMDSIKMYDIEDSVGLMVGK